MKASIQKYHLNFVRPAGTSRGTYSVKETYFIQLKSRNRVGIGECSLFRGLSADDCPNFETKLLEIRDLTNINKSANNIIEYLKEWPSIAFGLETALKDLESNNHILYPSAFTENKQGIRINGLIWMGDKAYMKEQISQKLERGFNCIKLKIGALKWEDEKAIITNLRLLFGADTLEVRVDANGGFSPTEAPEILETLHQLNIHSIEQPIKANQHTAMAELCRNSPIPIALDEELIGLHNQQQQHELLDLIKPHYIILKPGIIGGLAASEAWIDAANKRNIGWWITSSLESNIGLNAIAQWTYKQKSALPQGLGTGSLFTNNIASPLQVIGEQLFYNPSLNWQEVPNDWI